MRGHSLPLVVPGRCQDRYAEEIVPRRSGGYVDHGGKLENGEPLRPRVIAPNGGIMSSALDVAKWQIALAGGVLLKPSGIDEMYSPIRLNDGKPFNSVGLGWFRQTFRGHQLLLHNGSTIAGYSSVVYRYLDDDLAVIVLMNVDRWNVVNVLATRIANCYVPGLDAGQHCGPLGIDLTGRETPMGLRIPAFLVGCSLSSSHHDLLSRGEMPIT